MPQTSISALDRRSYSSQNDSVSNAVLSSTEQNISVTDIISEGPIEGLVNGAQSVFLNNDPLAAEEESFYKNSEALATVSSGSTSVNISLNKQALKVRKGAARKFLHLYAIKTVKCTVSNFVDYDELAIASLVALTQGDLTRVSGDSWDDDWNVANTDYVGPTQPAEGAYLINLTTASDKKWSDIKLTPNANSNIVHFHRPGYDIGMFEDDETDGVVEHTVTVDIFLEIAGIDPVANTVTLKNAPPADALGEWSFSITSPIDTVNWERKHPGSGVRFNPGTLEQEALPTLEGVGTSSVALSISNASLEKFNGSNYTTVTASGAQAAQIDEVKLIIQYPSGMYLQVDRSGSLYTAGVAYHIELKVDNGLNQGYRTVEPPPGMSASFDSSRTATENHGGTPDTVVWKFTKRTKTKFSQEVRVPLEALQPFTGFTIRISRITKHDSEDYTAENRFRQGKGGGGIDSGLSGSKGGSGEAYRSGEKKHHTGVYTSQLTQALGLIKERLSFPYTAYAHTTFSSKTFQQNPTRAYECKGMKVFVPKNYITREENDGVNAKYTRYSETLTPAQQTTPQLWDGTFRDKRIYTDNPAWVFYDICTNDRYGLGDFLLESDIDKFSLYKVAKYCDELVPDGKGGLEPRFRSNIYLTKATDAYKILKDFATVFRGILYWSNSQFVTVIDEPKEPIFTFNRSNVIDGSFEYQSTGNKTRVNQVIVNWNNPEAEYKIEPLIIEDRENIIKTGIIKSEKAVAFGCTSEGQAVRYGRWKLWTSVNQTKLVSFKTGINAAFLNPGDIINIQDEAEYRVPFSGRVSSYNSSAPSVTIDREISSHFLGSFGENATYKYTISVLVPKTTVVLNQEAATVNTSDSETALLSRGDELTKAKVGNSVVTLIHRTTGTVSGAVNNSTSVTLSSADSLITVGDTVIGTAVDKNITVAAINGTSLTLSAAQTIADTTSLIFENEDLTNRNIISAVDTSGDNLNLQYVKETIVEERLINHSNATTSGGKDTLPLEGGAFTVAPSNGDIWAIKEVSVADSIATQVSYKQYKILDIAESDKTEYSIGAVEHYNTKFDSVDRELVLSDPDPLFYREDSSTDVPPPQNVRVLRTSDPNLGGEELTLEWDPPAASTEVETAFSEYEHLSEYEVTQTFTSDSDKPITFRADRNELSHSYVNVQDGIHEATVTTISKSGRRSLPVRFPIDVEDIFTTGNWNRHHGIIEGAYSTVDVEILNDGDDAGKVQFTNTEYVVAPLTGIRYAKENTEEDADTYSLDVTVLTGGSWPTASPQNQGYIFMDYSEVDQQDPGADPLKLIVRIQDKSFGGNLDYWYDAKKFIADPNSIWTQVATNVAVTQGSNKITGSGLLGVEVPFTVKIGSSFGAKIAWVKSDSEAYLDRPWTDSSTTATLYKAQLEIDYERDFLIAPVYYSQSTYYLGVAGSGTFLRIVPNLNIIPRALIAPITPAVLNYDGDDNSMTTTYNSITLDVTATGYQYAQLKVTGDGFTQTDRTADADYVDTIDNIRSITLHSDNSAIAYSNGTPLNFTLEAREKLDPANTDKQRSRVLSLVKMKDGSIGLDGKTAKLTSQDYSVIYDEEGLTPTYNGDTADKIILTATPYNYTAPIFKFTRTSGTDTVLQDWADVDGVGSVTITNGGSGYSSVPTVAFAAPSSGTTATGTAVVTNNAVTGILITDGGSGYTSVPAISFSGGGGGSSAAATAVLSIRSHSLAESSNIPTEFDKDDWPKVIKLEVGEKPSGWSANTPPDEITSTDSISIVGVKLGAGGVAIVNSNHAHSYTTDKDGKIGGNHNQTITGSGTTLELIVGGVVYDYKADSNTAYGYSGTLAAKQWKIHSAECSTGANHIQVGVPTGADTDDVVTIGAHKTGTGQNNDAAYITDDNEVVTYTIKYKQGGVAEKTITTTQTFSKSKEGETGKETNYAFVRLPDGVNFPDNTAATDAGEDLPADFTVGGVTYAWADDIATTTGTNFLWQVFGSRAPGADDYTWGKPHKLEAGAAVEIFIYSDKIPNSGNAPDRPDQCTYNFVTKTITIADTDNAIAAKWNLTPPDVTDDKDIIYVSKALAVGPKDVVDLPIAATGSAGTKNMWEAPVTYITKIDGAQGKQLQEIDLYYPVTSSPWTLPSSAPTTGIYTFSTGVVASIPTGWTQTKPTIGVGQQAAQSKALATEAEAGGDESGSLTWSTPVQYSNSAPTIDYIFKYETSPPSAPAATVYPALPSGWTTTVPGSGSGKLYSSKGTAELGGSMPNFTYNYTWQTPVVHTQTWSDISGTTDAPEDGADVTADNTANDTANVDGTSSSTIKGYANRAGAGLDSLGNVQRTVPGSFYTNTTYANLAALDATANGLLNSANQDSTADIRAGVTKTHVGLGNLDFNLSLADLMNQNFTGTFGGVSNADIRSGAALGATANQATTAQIQQGVITATIILGSATHSWTQQDSSEYAPTGTTQTTKIEWRDGEGTLKAAATIVSTLNTSTNKISVSQTQTTGTGIQFDGTTSNIGDAGSTTTATYENIKVSVFHSVIDMTSWTFK